jgi:hypothetical protein
MKIWMGKTFLALSMVVVALLTLSGEDTLSFLAIDYNA